MTELRKLKLLILFVAITYVYTSNIIDVDDILAEDYMPGTLLVLENPTTGINTFNRSIKHVEEMEKTPDGSFNNAMETMNFHRSMMNQYLCRNFVAEQIIKDMTTSRINRRMGHVTPGSDPVSEKSSQFKPPAQNSLINDEGSYNYKNWLSKSATLEDIYRHYDQAQNKIDIDVIEDEEKGEDFDEEYNGHLTGYVNPQPHETKTPVKHRGHTGLGTYYAGGGGYPYPNAMYHQSGGGYHYGGGGSGGGAYTNDGTYGDEDYSHHDTSGGAYGGHHVMENIYHGGPPKYQVQHESSYGSKEKDLSDLFDIALTALAFLSFGLFIVHVIMCISATNQNATTTPSVMMPMSMGPTATGTGNSGGGGSMTSTGGGSTDGGTADTGTGGGMTATGGGTTSTGDDDGEATNTGGGVISTGGGATGTGGGDMDGGGGETATGVGETATGGGDIDDIGGGTGTGGGDMGTGGGDDATGGGITGSGSPGIETGGDGTGIGMGDGEGTGTGTGKDTFRLRRDIPTITNPDNQALNELARRVLTSIEAALVANNDDGVCLRWSLCENNKYSRNLESKNKLIIPMWSLGMSWLAGRLVKTVPSSTSMLDSLKASILGLGRANCEIIYRECDLRQERRKRRRRRRKRAAK